MHHHKVSVLALSLVAVTTVGRMARAEEPTAATVVTPDMPPPSGAVPAPLPPPAPAAPAPGATQAPAAAPAPVPAPAPAPQPVAAPGPAQATPEPAQENPIPPYVEGQAIAGTAGGYCFGGPHPAPGGGWEASQAPHMHNYAPFDLRLFQYHNGCYYFVGDPRDFGYNGQTYSYYGAHPILDAYGGGWCFMIGAHSHWWRPWSPYFTVVGPWYYWYGPYDPLFWAYWPYYSFYYRSYYPSYYAGGAFYRNWRAAPPITRVPATGWRGSPPGTANAAAGWRGAPPVASTSSALRSSGASGAPGNGWRGAPPTSAARPMGGVPYQAPAANGGWRSTQVPFSVPRANPSFRPQGGGFHGGAGWRGGGGFRGGRR